MKYIVLAETYSELERIPSKLKKTEIIAKLFKETPANLLEAVTLLIQGRVFPSWSEKEIGVAEQLMIKAIAKSAGVSAEDVVKDYKKSGDLGLAVETLVGKKRQRTLGSEQLTVGKVFANLQAISEHSGGGSQDRKLDLIAELLSQATATEAKYIVRTVLEQLRVGVAEGLVRDAVASAYNVPVDDVENAWNLLPDFGEVAKAAKEGGEKGLKKFKLRLGTPFIVQLAEKSPSLKDAIESYKKVLLEYKYDGMRTLIHKKGEKVWLFTRNLENITAAFPDLVQLARKNIKADDCVLDGETIGLDRKTGKPVPFQQLSTRIKRKYDIEKSVEEIPIDVNLFDIVYLDGKNLMELTLEERKKCLAKSIHSVSGKFHVAEGLVTTDLKEADAFYKEALKAGEEGVIVKDLNALYVPGRRVAGGWLKVKPVMENLDVVIVGGTWGTGKRAGTIGSLHLAIRDAESGKFLECGMMGTGLKEKTQSERSSAAPRAKGATESEQDGSVTLKEMTKLLKPLVEHEAGSLVKFKPKIVIEVAYEEIQKSPTYISGFALRFPRFIRLRPDKSADEADTIERVKTLYGQQKGKK
ncbi:MAG: ATP-dependent DNA ligase [DPANN group archaeon]|nr:ATP-dependent DNA ligase [DPANN group archaeon]